LWITRKKGFFWFLRFFEKMTDETEFLAQRERLVDAAKEIFTSDSGEILLEQLKKNYGFYSPNFSTEPHETSYREGQRSVVLYLMQLITEEPKQLEGE
tara:strand:+ start:813 stop:1106 length:294 start_codon:yes stop_codon:yes gene_type:complete